MRMKKNIAVLLCLAMLAGLISGCAPAHTPEAYEPTGNALEGDTPVVTGPSEGEEEQVLSLAYYADQPLNPLETVDYTNKVLISLMYQGLFAVDRNYEVIPILCKNYKVSADQLTYEFTVDPAATFSDGVPVMPEDVVASLKKAQTERAFSGRLRYVYDISVTEERNVQIRLYEPYGNLPLLLDIPIVKADQIDFAIPLGTGPYRITGWGWDRSLTRCDNWWCKSDDLLITAKTIPLEIADSPTGVRDAFEFRDVSVVCTDPGSDRYVEYRCDYELWDCETGIFVYLGINTESDVFQSQTVRKAISRGINRDLLAEEYYRGFAWAAELPASPNSPYYTAPLAKQYAYDAAAFQSGMSSIKGRTIKLLVNSSDSLRVRVAYEISRMLNASGVVVEVVEKPSNAYEVALVERNYDMYLGQTKLSANMDLTPFFATYGNLSYGGIDDVGVYTLCLQALENQGNYYTLHQRVMEDAYLCPILFRSYAVYASRGMLTELKPARDNLFCYSIGRTLTDAYILDDE